MRITPERLAELVAAALPAEELSAEELSATLFDDADGAVLGSPDGVGAVGVAVRGDVGFVTVIVVDPSAQRRGVGSALLESAHSWLQAAGATSVRTGASAPRYLWPGVDESAHRAAMAMFVAAGYEPVGAAHNHRCPTAYRAAAPPGITLRRVGAGSADEAAVRAFAAGSFPAWLDEVARAVPNGCCHAAFDDSGAVGFACHSVNRAGWIGPMATDPACQGRGVGSALLGAVCRDLQLAELDHAEIAWVGPDAFYEKAGATVSRRFVVLGRQLP